MEIEEQKKKDEISFSIFKNPARVLDRYKN